MKTEQKLITVSVVSALLAVVVGYLLITEKEKSVMRSMEPQKVIVASKYIPAKSKIQKDHLKYAEIPGKFVTKAHTADYKQLADKVTLVPFVKGEPVLVNKLSDKNDDLNAAIPTGLRAMSVSVDEESGVGKMIKQGDYVDVLLTFQIMEKKYKYKYTATATVLQAIQVIAIGNSFTDTKKKNSYESVTLALTPEEAEILTFAKEKGKINLVLRALGDRQKEKVKLASFDELIDHIKRNEQGEDVVRKKFIMDRAEKIENKETEIKKREE